MANKKLNQNYCLRCFGSFVLLLNPKRVCFVCKFKVCKKCSQYTKNTWDLDTKANQRPKKVYVCFACHKQKLTQIIINFLPFFCVSSFLKFFTVSLNFRLLETNSLLLRKEKNLLRNLDLRRANLSSVSLKFSSISSFESESQFSQTQPKSTTMYESKNKDDHKELESSSSEKWQLTALDNEEETKRQDKKGMGDYVSLNTSCSSVSTRFSSFSSNSSKYKFVFALLCFSSLGKNKWSFERSRKKIVLNNFKLELNLLRR